MWNLSKFSNNEDGNVAMMFAIVLSMLLFLIGVGIDFSNVVRLQKKLQGQVDAGVLAAATTDVRGDVDVDFDENDPKGAEKKIREAAAYSVIEANGFDFGKIKPDMVLTDESVTLTAKINYTPFFGKLIGKDVMTLSATAESGLAGITGVEIVLVLDNTGSMSENGKMDALKTGATNLVKAIETSESGSKIGVVPFARYVRVHEGAKSESWFQMPLEYDTERTYQQATHTGGTCIDVVKTRIKDGVEETYTTSECTGQTTTYEDATKNIESRWDGCVGTRMPPYSEQDGSYMQKVPGLLDIVPYENSTKNYDRSTWCTAEITPMTTDYKTVIDRISWLWPTDVTYIPTGLLWGQRVLSPGMPYDNKNENGARQIMVLMTDGMNTAEIKTDAQSFLDLNAPPYIDDVPDQTEGSPEGDAATTRLCNSVKASGVEIYTIAFQVTDPSTQTLLKNCASDASKALTADNNASLITQFETITQAIKDEVRLIR